MNYKPAVFEKVEGEIETGFEGWYFVCPCGTKQGPFDSESLASAAARLHERTH